MQSSLFIYTHYVKEKAKGKKIWLKYSKSIYWKAVLCCQKSLQQKYILKIFNLFFMKNKHLFSCNLNLIKYKETFYSIPVDKDSNSPPPY